MIGKPKQAFAVFRVPMLGNLANKTPKTENRTPSVTAAHDNHDLVGRPCRRAALGLL